MPPVLLMQEHVVEPTEDRSSSGESSVQMSNYSSDKYVPAKATKNRCGEVKYTRELRKIPKGGTGEYQRERVLEHK
jgi:hypothetical protein